MRTPIENCLIMSLGLVCALLTEACGGPRVLVATGTLVGLEATPGVPQEGQSPAVTFGYRRTEAALVPVEKPPSDGGKKESTNNNHNVDQQGTKNMRKDAASILATFNLTHNWFGPAKIEQYIATGHAAQDIAKIDPSALLFIGYEQGEDPLADKLANAYINAGHDQAAKACWNKVKVWMNDNFPNLPPLDIVTRAFIKQRLILFKDAQIKEACPDSPANQP